MKQLNITFEDSEYKFIKKFKDTSKLNWRNFLILIVTHCIDAVKKGDLKFEK